MTTTDRILRLKASLDHPLLIKKKENLLYLTGCLFMHGYLLVQPISGARAARLKKRGTYATMVFFGDGLEKVAGIKADRLRNVAQYLGKADKLEVEDEFTLAEYEFVKAKIKDSGLRLKVEPVRSPVDLQRMVKDPGEIALVKKSMEIVERVFHRVRSELKKPGMTERRLADFIKSEGLRLGAEDVSFAPIVASGANAAIPHHVPRHKKLKKGESIILDFGFKYKGYCSDFTRTVFLKTAPRKLADAYNQVEEAYNTSISFVSSRPSHPQGDERRYPLNDNYRKNNIKGIPRSAALPRNDKRILAGDVYQKSVDVLKEKKLDKYYIHSLGHGTGLEIHELPNLAPGSKQELQNGMVFSIEPGVYLPGAGGVRIEDLVYLKEERAKRFIDVSTRLADNII